MDKKSIDKLCISLDDTIIQALKRMDQISHKLLIVLDNDRFFSIITIGDIQRAIINAKDLNTPISEIIDNETKVFANTTETKDVIKERILSMRAELMPVLDKYGNLADVYLWTDFYPTDSPVEKLRQLNVPVVIMAGGKGTRLRPLTNVYPKPLIPVGEKTVAETIMDKFVEYGCHDFYYSVNYKAETIKNYFAFVDNKNYNITYFQEDRPMGTAGSLRLLKDKLNDTFFVSNCDTLINEDYSKIFDYHRNNGNELTVVAAMMSYSIPFGTIVTKENGLLESIEEKPTLSYKINTGLYILEPSVLNEIPDEFFHITHLMEKLHEQNRRVGVYPIQQNDWIDMGDWDEYLKLVRK